MPLLRAICKQIDSVQPHGEPLISYRTFDFDSKELRDWLTEMYTSRQVVAVEVLKEPLQAAKPDDDIPF